ncbi:MAG: efflux RND transporter periplasmic adaptor subunit [Bacteroidota bacterium]
MAKKKRRNWIIWLLVFLIIALVSVAAITNRNKPRGEKVFVEKAEKRTILEMVAASGKVFPQTEVKISPDVSGEIVELYVEEGDSVQLGQVLAKIDPDAYQSQVERGRANVNSAKAQLANSKSNVETQKAQKEQIEAQLANFREIHQRNEELYKDGVISELDYEASLTNVKQFEANLRSSEATIRAAEQSVKSAQYSIQSNEATLKELQTSLRRTTIYSPVTGIVSQLNVEQGERVVGTVQMAGTEMMRIANLNAMEVRVEVSENDIPRVSIGDDVDIEVDAYLDRKFKGKVTQIGNSAISATGVATLTSDQVTNFEVRISILPTSYQDLISVDKPYPFRPGMSASVEVNTLTEAGVVAVPIQAVTTREKEDKEKDTKDKDDDLREVVFVVVGDTVAMLDVVTGIQDDTYIKVIKGIEEGAEIVSGPYTAISRKLKSGMTIQKVDEDEIYGGSN